LWKPIPAPSKCRSACEKRTLPLRQYRESTFWTAAGASRRLEIRAKEPIQTRQRLAPHRGRVPPRSNRRRRAAFSFRGECNQIGRSGRNWTVSTVQNGISQSSGAGKSAVFRDLSWQPTSLYRWFNPCSHERWLPRGWFHAGGKTSARAFLSTGVDSGATLPIKSTVAAIPRRHLFVYIRLLFTCSQG